MYIFFLLFLVAMGEVLALVVDLLNIFVDGPIVFFGDLDLVLLSGRGGTIYLPMTVALFCSLSSMELSLVSCWRERSLPLSRLMFDCVFLIVAAASIILLCSIFYANHCSIFLCFEGDLALDEKACFLDSFSSDDSTSLFRVAYV